MRMLTDSQWERYSVLIEQLNQQETLQRETMLREMREHSLEDRDVVSLVALHFGLPPEADRCRTGERVGNFTLGVQIGSGGMGVVYRAKEDPPLEREVALKLIHPTRVLTGPHDAVERFNREIQTLAKFECEGIARIYTGGVHIDSKSGEEIPFFAMQLVNGGTPITTHARAHALTVSERLELFSRVCEAMEAAHQKLIVHRDLKPTNILVDRAGRPFVIDFGLAQVCDPANRYRDREFVSGTPAYMSPEQASSTFGPVEQLSDVYTLGVILYELLAGRLPYNVAPRDSWEAFRQELLSSTPPELGQYNGQCRGDLETIVAKALAKHPMDRYPSVAALNRAIRRYLDWGERIEIEKAIRAQVEPPPPVTLSPPSPAQDVQSQSIRQLKPTERLRFLDSTIQAANASSILQYIRRIGIRKVFPTLLGIIIVMSVLWWFSPYAYIIRGHMIMRQASHEEDVMRAVNVYKTAIANMGSNFWRRQRALILNRLGRIYAARRFSRYASELYRQALQENAKIAVIHTNMAFLLEEMAEQEAYRSGDMKRFKEVHDLYEKALRLDAQDPFTQALQDGLPRRIETALNREQVEKLLSAPQGCRQPASHKDDPTSHPLTLAFHTTQRHGSFASRAGEGEVLLQRLIETLQESGRVAVHPRSIEDNCFVVHLIATYRIDRSPRDPLHQQMLYITFTETDTAESWVEANMKWTHGALDGITEKLASHIIEQLSRAYSSRQPDVTMQGGQQP